MDATAVYYPDFETFQGLAAGAPLVPVYRRLVSDSLTPVTAFHKLDAGRCACLFESVVGGEKVGRYSFLATEPFFEIEAVWPTGDHECLFGVIGRWDAHAGDPPV